MWPAGRPPVGQQKETNIVGQQPETWMMCTILASHVCLILPTANHHIISLLLYVWYEAPRHEDECLRAFAGLLVLTAQWVDGRAIFLEFSVIAMHKLGPRQAIL